MTADPLNADVDREGFSWAPEGVIGYELCSQQGEKAVWKENKPNEWYRFTVFESDVKQIGSSKVNVPVKSFQVPKGFKLEYKGMLLRDKYETPLSKQQLDLIAAFPDKSFGKHVTTFTDETCAINMFYWYMNMQVTALEYIRIARRIPNYLSLSIECQKLYIQKGILKKKIDESTYNCKSSMEELKKIETDLIEYNRILTEIKSKYSTLQTELTIVTKIVTSEITVEQWVEQAKDFKEQNQKLEIKIAENEEKIKKIRVLIAQLQTEVTDLEKENSTVNIKINEAQTEISTTTVKITQSSMEITTYEEQISKLNLNASNIKSNNDNSKAKIEIKKTEVKKLQDEIAEMEKNINSTGQEYTKIINEIETITNKKETVIKTKTALQTSITKTTKTITENEKKVKENTQIIAQKQEKIFSLNRDINEITKSILKIREIINANISNARKETIEYYRKKKVTIEESIEVIKISITTKESEISIKEKRRNEIHNTIQQKNSCQETFSNELNSVTSQIDNQMKRIKQEYTEITNIFSEQSEYLARVMTTFSSDLDLEMWALSTKDTLSKYLHLVPGNPQPIFDMVRRRRRRFRRIRRRFI